MKKRELMASSQTFTDEEKATMQSNLGVYGPDGTSIVLDINSKLSVSSDTYYTKSQVDELMPSKTSDLTNDSGFVTSDQIPSSYVKTASVSDDNKTLTLTKQDDTTVDFSPDGATYTAGTNIDISTDNTISVTGTKEFGIDSDTMQATVSDTAVSIGVKDGTFVKSSTLKNVVMCTPETLPPEEDRDDNTIYISISED